jgi:hypothetical protein
MKDLGLNPDFLPGTNWVHGESLQRLRAFGRRLDRPTTDSVMAQMVGQHDADEDMQACARLYAPAKHETHRSKRGG